VGNSNSAWGENTIDGLSVIKVESGNASSISSNQPTLNSSSEKYRARGVNERQEVNPLIALSDSGVVNDLEKDEFRFCRDYLAYDFNDSRKASIVSRSTSVIVIVMETLQR
jgi:hypothetical protein